MITTSYFGSFRPILAFTFLSYFQTFVLLSDDIDPDEIASPLAETLMSVRAADFLATGADPNEVILGLKV